MAQVSIVMPLYNKAGTVKRAIESILKQNFADWRLVVVDDGSTDEGAGIVRGMDDERIELIEQDNRGPGAARNAGIARVKSEYVAFLDADDEWYPWFLSNSWEAIREQEVSLVASMYYSWPEQRDMTALWRARGVTVGRYALQGDEDVRWVYCLTPFLTSSSCLVRTKVVEKYGGFYEKDHCIRAEDETLFIPIAFNESFAIIEPAAMRYHTEDSTMGYRSDARPLEPFLQDPEVVLRYCSPEKRALMLRLLDRRALATAYDWAYYGEKTQATALLGRYPGAKSFTREYREFLYIRYIRPRFWTKFKCKVGPPVRAWVRSLEDRWRATPRAPEL